MVCIDSPSGWSTSGSSRSAERQLSALGIQSFRTGADPGGYPFYAWMRVGIEIFAKLRDMYPLYRRGPVSGTAVEVFPNASATLLAGQLRARKESKLDFRKRSRCSDSTGYSRWPHKPGPRRRSALRPYWTDRSGRRSRCDRGRRRGSDPASRCRVPLATAHGPLGTCEVKRTFSPTARRRTSNRTTAIGFVNRNSQTVLRANGLRGADHGQYVYLLHCGRCAAEYGVNRSDIHLRRCPVCDYGRPGLAVDRARHDVI